jgi:hypothetical protein
MASTTARPRPAKKTTARPPRAAAAGVDFEPIHIAADEDVPEERVPLFYIGDTEYSVPASIPAGAALEYLRVAREAGPEVGAGALLSRTLGDEAYQALERSRGLTDDQLNQIITIVLDLALGRAEKGGKAAR